MAKYRLNWQLQGAGACMRVWSPKSPVRSLSRSIQSCSRYPSTKSFGGVTFFRAFEMFQRFFTWQLLDFFPLEISNSELCVYRDHRCKCFILLAASLSSLVGPFAAPDGPREVKYYPHEVNHRQQRPSQKKVETQSF